MLNNSSIKAKLLLTVIGSIVAVALIMLFESTSLLKNESDRTIKDSTSSAFKAKEKELENYVSLAYKTVESYHARTSPKKVKQEVQNYLKEQTNFLFSILEKEYENNKNLLSEEELKNRLIETMNSARYGKSGYFWINDMNTTMVSHPIKPSLNGKELSKIKDKAGKNLFVEMVNVVKASKEGFVDYMWPKPGFDEPQQKISFVKLFKPYNWVIGTGEYLDNVEERMKKEAMNAISKMRYGKSGYFWINNSQHVVLMHPIKPSLEGESLVNLKDKKGTFIYQEIVKTANAKKEGGVVKYFWPIPGKPGVFEKFSYVKKFEPWDLIIGTGAYITDIEQSAKALKENTQESIKDAIIKASIIIIALLVVLSIVILLILKRVLFNPLDKFQEGLLNFFKYINKEQNDIQPLHIIANDEIGKMTVLINDNIDKTKTIIEQDNLLINDVKKIVNRVSEGFLDNRIDSSTNNESLEELKSLLNNMLDSLQKLVGNNINALSEVLEDYANRDFTKKIDKDNSGKIGTDIINMNRMITHILRDNQNDGISLQEKSNELTSNVQVLNENATSQAASLEETAASIEEITGNIRQTSEKAQEMLNISSETQDSAHKGKELASKTVNSMDEINETVMNINEAITVIDQIAFQTNILSLNAAVEAATAGEAGKGFAVVAQEVRNLAARSAEAAKEIKELVESATVKANEGKSISTSMIEGFNELEDKIQHTSDLINDVTHAASEQNSGMIQISDAVNQLDKFTQENASIAERTNTIAKETNTIANDIVENVGNNDFDGKVN